MRCTKVRPRRCRHRGCVRAADQDVRDAVGARELEQRRHRVARLQPAHLGAELAGALDVVDQMRCASEAMRVGASPGVST